MLNIDDYLVAIDDVEKRSGLDVLWELPDELEGRVESAKNVKWVKEVFYTETEPPVVKRKPAPTPKPGPTPTTGLELKIISVTSPIRKGNTATLEAKTNPGAHCTITVYYKSGPSGAQGLKRTPRADEDGYVMWSWKVGGNTTPGKWPIKVTAELEGKTATEWTEFTVTGY